MSASRPRVVLLSNYPVPHQEEFFAAIRAEGSVELDPLFLGRRDPSRSWPDAASAQLTVLRSLPARVRPELRLPLGLLPRIASADLLVVGGYSFLAFQEAMLAAAAQRKPFLLWAELPRLHEGGLAVRAARLALLQPVRLSAGILAIGSRAAASYRALFGPRLPVVDFPYVCNIDRYLAVERGPVTSSDFTLLYCGQLIERKGVDVLAEAFLRARESEPRLRLVLAGEGSLRASLEARLAPARDAVEFAGFVPWERLPALHARASALVIPSRHDGWALVVNEALAAGLPVVASTAVGAAVDLIRDRENGLLVPPGEAGALTRALLRLPAGAAAMGEEARRTALEKLRPEMAAARFGRIARGALANSLAGC